MRKIDFSKIVVKDINDKPYEVADKAGAKVPYDFAKVLGNGLFYGGKDIRISELGQKVYHHEEVELTDEELKTVRDLINAGFAPFILLSVNPQLDEMLKEV